MKCGVPSRLRRRVAIHWRLPVSWVALSAVMAFPALADVSFAIRAEVPCVEYAGTFTAFLELDEAGSEVDGYEVTVQFDGDLLDVVSIQEGPLMTGVCGQTWWYHTQTESSVFISHVLLCGGPGITGPGELSSITFQATSMPGDSPLRLVGAEFYRAGHYVTPVHVHDNSVTVAVDCPGSGCPESTPRGTCLWANQPNPFSGGTLIEFDLPAALPVKLSVYDVSGRLVRVLVEGEMPAGGQAVVWDRRDGDRCVVPGGVYLYRLDTRERTLTRKMTVMD
jgi:hypothetical protein